MSYEFNPDDLMQDITVERQRQAAIAASELLAARDERQRQEAIIALKTVLQKEIATSIKNSGPRLAELLSEEGRRPDGNSLRPEKQHYKEKGPFKLFGSRYVEFDYTKGVPDRPVWFITSFVDNKEYKIDEAKGDGWQNVPDTSDYVSYYKTSAHGICVDANGEFFGYAWESNLPVSRVSYRQQSGRLETMAVSLWTPPDNDIVPLDNINEEATNGDAIVNWWQDRMKGLLKESQMGSNYCFYYPGDV